MQLHKVSIFAFVLTLACLTNMALGDKSCAPSEIQMLQSAICGLSIFPDSFLCNDILDLVVEKIYSCSEK
ncbi:hypothetical protein ACLKA7_000916 [Drosophila subpalustris]